MKVIHKDAATGKLITTTCDYVEFYNGCTFLYTGDDHKLIDTYLIEKIKP